MNMGSSKGHGAWSGMDESRSHRQDRGRGVCGAQKEESGSQSPVSLHFLSSLFSHPQVRLRARLPEVGGVVLAHPFFPALFFLLRVAHL